MLVGKLEDLPDSLTALSTTGILSNLPAKRVEAWIDAAVGADLLRPTEDAYRTLALTRRGRDVMTGRATDVEVTLPEPARPAARGKKRVPAPAADIGAPDEALLDRLRAWRREEAARRGVSAYVVFHDRTLAAIAARRPATRAALSEVSGLGPAKLEAYGRAILSLVAPGAPIDDGSLPFSPAE